MESVSGMGSDFRAFGFGAPLAAVLALDCDLGAAMLEEEADFLRPEAADDFGVEVDADFDLDLFLLFAGDDEADAGASDSSERESSPSTVRSTKTEGSDGPAMVVKDANENVRCDYQCSMKFESGVCGVFNDDKQGESDTSLRYWNNESRTGKERR